MVRVTTPSRRLEGTLAKPPSDSLVLTDRDGRRESVALASVRQVEVAAGRSSHVLLGAGLGAAVGAAGGLLYANAIEDVLETEEDPSLAGAALGALIGTPVGAVIGLLINTRRWEPVHIAGLGVSIAF
ncbi:MAG TPA: hypothetical protein VHJ69_02840 [Gemmatimonadales bacterium]|nr:hypothetical protein [Gemmatimonadales bacterium]